MTTEHFSSEQKILRVMRKVLASIVKDVTPQDGASLLLTERTIEDIRDIFGLISLREKELIEALGQVSITTLFIPATNLRRGLFPLTLVV